MRSAKEAGCFPYNRRDVCYMEVFPDGTINQLSSDSEKYEAASRAKRNMSAIYAVWPGNWRSDLFVIDDIDAFCEEQNLFERWRKQFEASIFR